MTVDELRGSPAFRALRAASARAGRDPLQVQGPGGNTSIKDGRIMLIKASGTWLAEAEEREIMVAVDLDALRAAVAAGDPAADQPQSFLVDDPAGGGLRPSIETAVHGALRHRIVIHTHCVETIAVAAREDAEAVVAERLAAFDAVFIPYVKPGAALAREITTRIGPGTDVLVLGNHGLVVGAETAEAAEELAAQVARALAHGARDGAAPADGFAAELEGSGWTAAPDPATQALAMDPQRFALAVGGSLYPDHVIFLGPGVVALRPEEPLAAGVARAEASPPRRLILAPGRGAAAPSDASPSVLALARALGDVVARIEPGASLKRLSAAEEAALLDWDAEKHRQTLEAARAGR
ncbi:MAG: class II aldolase/adducin family protein [Pseudomonadota bacterium]